MTPPVPDRDGAAEVRVEWGVRYRAVESRFDTVRVRYDKAMGEVDAREQLRGLLSRPEWYADAGIVRRTVTTTPWTTEGDER